MPDAIPPELAARIAGLRAQLAHGNAAGAEPVLRALLDLLRASLGAGHLETASVEVELAEWLLNAARPRDAIALLSHAMRVLHEHREAVGLRYPDALHLFAEACDQSGRDTDAMDWYRTAHREYVALAGGTHPEAIRSAISCGEVLRVARDHDGAERWFRRALSLARAADEVRMDFVAHASNNLAETLLAAGRADDAVSFADEALDIRVRAFGAQSPQALRSRGVVASIALARGDEVRLQAMIDASRAEAHPDEVTLPADVVAGILAHQGRLDEAVSVIEQSLARLAGEEHDAHASLRPHQHIDLQFLLARLLRTAGRPRDALQRMQQAFEHDTARLADEAGSRSRRQMRLLLRESRARLADGVRLLLEMSDTTDADRASLYRVLQERRSLETRLLSLQKQSFLTDRALTTASPEAVAGVSARVERLLSQLADTRLERLRLLLQRADTGAEAGRDERVVDLGEYAESIERQLAQYVGEGSRDWIVSGVESDIPRVREDEVVIEYVHANGPVPSYVAFVVSSHGISLADLGDAASIDEGISQLRAELVEEPAQSDAREPRWRRRARFLANRVLVPLLPSLDGARHVFVVPDGALFSLPFDLLPVDASRAVIDGWSVSILWHGGELNGRNVTFGSVDAPGDPLVVSAPGHARDADATGHRFSALPFAAEEGRAVSAPLGGVHLHGAEATKDAVLDAQSPEILHLATHSFWIDFVPAHAGGGAGRADAAAHDAIVRGGDAPLLFQRRARLDDPLSRSGIALAGADAELDAPTAESPGLLFASEVIDLDLRQTDLVVMSSCQSGIGDPSPGDGVEGLRRAFRAAGADSVVSTLWKVPDEPTASLMTEFYRQLLARVPRRDALHAAKRATRDRYPDDPLCWAGFVLDGETGSLFRFSPLRGFTFATLSGVGLSLDRAREHIAAQEWDAALSSLDFILDSATADDELRATALYEKAGVLRQAGRPAEALPLYDDLVQRTALSDELLVRSVADRANTKHRLGDDDGARRDYTALLLRPGLSNEARAYLFIQRGAVLAQLGERALAIADCEAALHMEGIEPELREIAQHTLDAIRNAGPVPEGDGAGQGR